MVFCVGLSWGHQLCEYIIKNDGVHVVLAPWRLVVYNCCCGDHVVNVDIVLLRPGGWVLTLVCSWQRLSAAVDWLSQSLRFDLCQQVVIGSEVMACCDRTRYIKKSSVLATPPAPSVRSAHVRSDLRRA